VVLFPWDVRRLCDGLGLSQAEFTSRYLRATPMAVGARNLPLLGEKDGQCVFLARDNRCLVHEFKPTQCARGPFGFFWRGERDFACMKDVRVPTSWSSVSADRELMIRNVREEERMYGKKLPELAKDMEGLADQATGESCPLEHSGERREETVPDDDQDR
jgi:Fe-S-cluster containining protein